jgi:bacterioferritin B
MGMSAFTAALNEQVANEFAASQQYVAIAVWYDGETLPELAAHFYAQAVEERNHAMMLVRYLLDAEEPVTIPGVAVPRMDFDDPSEPVALALRQERTVTEQIKRLATLARDEGDLVGEQFLGWFLREQLEEMSSMAALLKVVERASATSILLAEDYLARTKAAGATAAGEGAGAPVAAGGAL